MVKKTVFFQVRVSYEVTAKTPAAAIKKAYSELMGSMPCVGDESEDGKVVCAELTLDQVLPMTEVKE